MIIWQGTSIPTSWANQRIKNQWARPEKYLLSKPSGPAASPKTLKNWRDELGAASNSPDRLTEALIWTSIDGTGAGAGFIGDGRRHRLLGLALRCRAPPLPVLLSPSHGLVCVGGRFLASSQLREPSASSGNVLYWSWNKVSYANLVYRGLGDDEAKLFDAMLLRSRTLKAFNLINRKLYSLEKLEF